MADGYYVKIDWENTGTFAGANDDVTANVKSVSFSRGKSDELGKAEVGTLSLTLKNSAGLYSPSNAAGALSGKLLPKRAVEVYYTSGSTDYPLYYGFLEEIIPHPHLAEQDCVITAVDGLDYLSRSELSTVLWKEHLTGEIINGILWEAKYPFDINRTNLVLELPLFLPDLDGSTIISKDDNQISCSVTGATWGILGRTFNGTSGFINAGTNTALNITGNLTVIVWVKRTAASGDNRTMFSKGTAPTGMGYCLQWLTADTIRFVHSDGSAGNFLDTTDTFSVNTWYQFAVTVSGGTAAIIYVNGASNKSGAINALSGNAAEFLCIGARDAGDVQNWGGPIGEVIIYDRTLTPTEIQANYLATKWRYQGLLDSGQDTVPYAYWKDIMARNAIGELEDSEQGLFLINRQGYPVFEDRHHRYTSTHQTSQATFSNTMTNITYSMNPSRIFNVARATVTPWTLNASTSELWRLQEIPSIPAGETVTWWGDSSVSGNPVFVDAWTTPVASTDYTANSASTGAGDNETENISIATTKFAQSIKLAVTNSATREVFITLLKARGTYYDDQTKVTRKAEDETSKKTYQKRTLTLDGKFMTDADKAQDYVDYAVRRYKDPQAQLTMSIMNSSSTNLTQILNRDISDRITVVNSKLGVSGDYFIDAMEHEIYDGGEAHVATYTLKSASNEDFWCLDFSALGTGTRLGY